MAKIFEEIYKSIVKKGLDNLVDATPQTTSTESNKVENKLKSGPISQTSINPVLNRNQKSLLDPINYVKNNLDTLKKTADIIGMASKQMNKAREEVGLKSPAHEITEPINNAVTGVLNKLAEDNKSLNKVQQEHLDASSSAYLDTNDIIQKIKNDRTYYSNLFDNDGNLKDYSSEIIRLQEVASNQFGSEDRKAAKQQLDLYKQYQSEQKKLVYASQYQELVNSGADNDTLNKFKKAVVQDNYNEAERVLANFGSTVQSFVGSQLNALNALTATVNKLTGGEPTMSDYPSHIIQEAEDLQSIIMSNANGAEQVAYKVYNGMAPFLYSLLLGGMTSQSFLGNQAAAQALTNRALLISDASVLGQKMKENMAKGYDFNTSVLNASLHAMLSHITESIGGESIANILTGDIGVHLLDNYLNYTSRALANPFISEMIEEGTEASIEPIIDSLTLNTGLTVEEYINQVFSKDTLEQMLIGGLGGLVMGAGSTFKTIYEFDSGVKKLADTIDINDSKDYSSAKEANEFFKTLIQETQDKLASGQVAEDRINETTNQLFVMKELQKSYATKISEYETMNPYADAFKPVEDVQNKLSDNPEQDIIKAAAPTIKQNVDDLVTAKQNYIQSTNELNSVVQQQLANKGITIDAIEYNNLTDDAKRQVELTSKYSQKLKSNVVFANMITKSGQVLDGLYNPETRQIIINPNAKTGALTAYVHEITHNTEGSAFYSLLKMLVKETYGNEYADNIKAIQDEYSTITRLSEEDAEKELVAITTQSLLDNEQFMDRLVRYNTSLAYQMYEEIKYISQTTGTALDAIEQNFMRAFSTKGTVENQSNDLQFLFMGENQQKENRRELSGRIEFSKGLTIEDLGRNKDLVAAHNLSEYNFLASINLGGFVFPSVAVTKDSVGHENYGAITLLFNKKTIDPANRNNRVYSGDAWTPTYPTVDYDVDANTTQAISNQLNSIVDFDSIRPLDNNYFLYNLQNGSQLNDALSKYRGDISTLASDNNALKYIFLTEKGQNIEIPRKPKIFSLKGNYTKGTGVSNYVLNSLLNSGYQAGQFNNMSFQERMSAYFDVVKNSVAEYYNKEYGALQNGQFGTNLVEDFDNYSADYILEQIDQYLRTAHEGVVDTQGLETNLNNAISQYGDSFKNDFAGWIRNNITSKIRYNTGIRNDKDMFTPSGARRSFAQLHDPYTAQNVLKYMKKQTGNDLRGAKTDSWGVGPGEIISTQLKEFKSIDEIIQNEGLIKNLDDEEYNQTYKTVHDSIYAISKEISSYIEAETGSTNYFELNDSSLQLIKDCMRKNNKKQMYDLYMKEFYPYANFKMSEENVSKAIDAIYGLKESIGDLPTRYFEAKPMRIVSLDEIQLAIIPNNSSDYLKETLNNLGINYVEYDPSVEGSRQSIIQAQDNLKFSKGLTLEDLKAQANLDKNKKSLKRYYSEVLGANLRRSSLGINELLDLATKDIRDNGSISEGVYNRLKESVWESTKVLQGNDYADAAAIRKFLKENPIEITQMEERDRMYLQKNFGSIGFKKGGNSFDTVMMEFNGLFPGLINIDNINSAKDFVDQVSSVLANIDKSKEYIVPGTEAGISEEEIYNDFSTKFDDAMANYTNDVSRITVVDKTEEVLEDSWKQNTQQVLNQIGDEELTVDNIDSILKHKKVSNRTLEAMERNKQMMIENADKWIKGYDTLREEFPLYSKETFSNACFETLVYGDISDSTREKMYNALSSMYDFENVLPDYEKDVNDFINEALTTFSNETKYKAGEIDMEPIRKAMKINEAYNGQTIEADTERFKNNTYLNNITSKFKDQLKKSWQPIVNDLLSLSTQFAEKTGKKLDRVISRYKTIDQNIDALCHGNLDLKTKMQNEIRFNLLDEAAKTKSDVLTYAQDVVNKIKDLGITEGSRENIAVQYILEGHTETVRSNLDLGDNTTQETINEFRSHPFEAYTLEDLKRDYNYQMENGRLAWENIVDAANLLKSTYDDIYKEITDSQLLANGDVEGNMDLELADAKAKVEQAFKVMYNIKEEIKLNGSKESTQAAYEIAKAKFNRLVNQYNALVTRDERGDSTRRQLTPYRENFSHHIVKRSVKSDIESIKDAGLMTPTQLAGISEQTKPNTMWATFSAAQDSLVYDPNALGSFTEYMKEAANVVSYNPVIISLRQLTRDIQATAQDRQLNKFVEYLTDYTNMLSGKRLGIDREVQKFVGDKGMKIISTLNKYAKAAALTGNIRSALVQFANIPSGLANLSIDVSPKELAIDIAYGIKDWINKDSGKHDLIKLSPFMNNRYFDFDTGKNGVMNSLDDFAKTMLQVGDKIGAETIWYSALNQGMRLGVPNAVKYADDITRKSIAGRTKEDMAVAMNSQVLNLLFPFQVENNNLYQNLKQYMRDGKAGAIITYGVSAYIFNAIIKAIMNSDDEILPEFVTPIVDEVTKGLKGEQGLDDTVQNALFGEIGEMISLMPVGSTLLNLTLNNDKANELFGDYNPSRYGTTNIGLSGIGNVISSLDNDNNRIAFADALSDLIAGYVKGGKQFIRTTEGLQSMGGLPKLDAEGNVVMTPVNYTKSGRIAYVNDQSNIPDWIRASLFGKYSTDPAREYIDSGFKTMTDKEQRIFELLNDSGTGTKEAYNTATEHTDLVNQSKEDETIDSSLRNKLIENGTYSDYMSTLTESYEKYLEDFDYENETPKTFKQFASSYGISSDDLKQDTYQGFYELYDLSEEQQKAFSEAMDIENSVNALGKTISNSGATQRRLIYEQQGIYDDILEFIEENNLDYSDFGLTKTVVGYNSSQINTMLEKIGMESNYTTDDKTSPSEPKNTYTSSGKSSSKSRLSTKQKSLLKMYLSIINSNYSNFQKIMNSMTSVQEAKSNIEKILKNIKG